MNAEIVDKIDSSDEWIRERSGIVSRHFAAEDESVIDMAEHAARQALEHAGISPEQLGFVLMATVTHPYQTPAAAPELAARLRRYAATFVTDSFGSTAEISSAVRVAAVDGPAERS